MSLRHASCVVFLACLAAGSLGAAEIVFADGRIWSDVRILSESPTSLIVMHGNAVETVHAADLTAECRTALRLQVPAAEAYVAPRMTPPRVPLAAARPPEPARESSEPAFTMAPSVVREPASVVAVDPWIAVTEIWLDGRIIVRAGDGAFVRADGPPSEGRRRPDVGWLEGTVYIHPDARLHATVRDTPVSGRVVAAGEIRHQGGDGVVHVVAAYRLY